jgi:ribosomal protein L37AE/L43A
LNAPSCPNCRERLSDVEAGLVGVWTCLYCEGAWLPTKEAKLVFPGRQADKPMTAEPSEAGEPGREVSTLACPSCSTSSFVPLATPQAKLFRCSGCGGAYLPKQAVLSLGKALGGKNWEFGRLFGAMLGKEDMNKMEGAAVLLAIIGLLA